MAFNTGLEFSGDNRSRAPQMTGGVGAAGQSTVVENAAILNKAKPDIAAQQALGVQAWNYKDRAVKDANARAEINKETRETELDILSKDINESLADTKEKAAAAKTNAFISAGASLIGSALISDETTKNTIEKIEDSLTQLRGLQPVTYYYNEEYSSSPERLHHGFIAQEYQKVMPDATYFDESTGKLCIDTAELIALLVRGIQQLETRVTRMEAAHALIGAK